MSRRSCADVAPRSRASRMLPIACVFAALPAGCIQPDMTAAERLGFDPGDVVLIIHADDGGMCHAASQGVIECLDAGGASSASVMVPCPAAGEMFEYARSHPAADIGIHLTLNSEFRSFRWGPVAPLASVPTLLEPGTTHFWTNIQDTAFHGAAQQVSIELRAQVDRAVSAGLAPTHLDSHIGAVFLRPDFIEVYRGLAADVQVPCFVPRLSVELVKRFAAMKSSAGFAWLLSGQDATVDNLLGGYPRGRDLAGHKAYILDLLQKLPPGINEFLIHPAIDTPELRSVTGSWPLRVAEHQTFTDPEVVEFLHGSSIKLIGWREIGRRQRESKPLFDAAPTDQLSSD